MRELGKNERRLVGPKRRGPGGGSCSIRRPEALLLPRLPVLPPCQGLPFVIPKSPAIMQKPNLSSYRVQGTQLRVITVFSKPSEMSKPYLLGR